MLTASGHIHHADSSVNVSSAPSDLAARDELASANESDYASDPCGKSRAPAGHLGGKDVHDKSLACGDHLGRADGTQGVSVTESGTERRIEVGRGHCEGGGVENENASEPGGQRALL
jgi:hypothetical protein